jgi:hypothetical protein
LLNTLLGTLSSGVAAATGSYESIASATPTAGSTSVTFTSIPSTYASLQIRCISRRNDAGSAIGTDLIQFNSDTGANYVWHTLNGDGSTVLATGTTGASGIIFSRSTGASDTANVFGVAIADVHDYASSTKNKTVRSFTGRDHNNAGSSAGAVYLYSGLWLNTNAVTSITIWFNGNTIATGSTFSLYGIKG